MSAPGIAFAETVGVDDEGRNTALLVFPNGAPPGLKFSDVWDGTPLWLMRADTHASLVEALIRLVDRDLSYVKGDARGISHSDVIHARGVLAALTDATP